MKYFLIVLFLIVISFNKGYTQKKFYHNTGLHVEAGLHLACPSVLSVNAKDFKSAIPSWQVSIHKDFYTEKPIGFSIGLGAMNDQFDVRRISKDSNGQPQMQIRRIHMLYGILEAGPQFRFFRESKFQFLVEPSVQAGINVIENYSSMYVLSPGSTDAGFNGKLGTIFYFGPTRIYVQANYYNSFLKLAKNNYFQNGEAFESYIRRKSFGLQIGLYL